MSDRTVHQSAFSDAESEDLVQYKRVSLMAVVACFGGILSPTALTTPFMWWLPLVSAAFAIASLVAIGKQRDVLTGRKAALLGLWLALLFLSIAVTKHVARHRFLYRDAQPHCQNWLQSVLDGRLEEAHQLQMLMTSRRPAGVDLKKYYENDEDMADDLQGFAESEAIQKLTEIGPSGKIRHVSNEAVFVEYFNEARNEVVLQTFAIDYEQDGRPETLLLETRIERKRDLETGEVYWRMLAAAAP